MPPETTTTTPAIEFLRERQQTLQQRREEYVRWIETYDRSRTAPSQVADWVRSIEQLDHSINEVGLLIRDFSVAGL